MLRDLIWADNNLVFVGPTYVWHDQYLCDISISKDSKSGKRATLDKLLYLKPVPDIGNTFGESVNDHVQHQTFWRYQILTQKSAVSRAMC